MAAAFIDHPAFSAPAWNALHPLGFSRQAAVRELIPAMGWLDPADVIEARLPERETLLRFHDPDYIDAFEKAVQTGRASQEVRKTFGLGSMENPIFPGLFEHAAATVGGSIAAAQAALNGRLAFHPAGGTHHGRPDRASGFCYFNDPAYAVATFLDAGAAPVLYLDLDAHHGDGVEALFAGDPRVTCVSVHEENRWPYSGTPEVPGPHNSFNLAVPRGFNDSELEWLVGKHLAPLASRLDPAAIVITAGADCLHGDPLSAMELSNRAFWSAVTEAARWAPHAVVVGGGGYNPWTLTRAWAGLWSLLRGHDPAAPLTDAARTLLSGLTSDLVDEDEIESQWLASIADEPMPGPVRPETKSRAAVAFTGI